MGGLLFSIPILLYDFVFGHGYGTPVLRWLVIAGTSVIVVGVLMITAGCVLKAISSESREID